VIHLVDGDDVIHLARFITTLGALFNVVDSFIIILIKHLHGELFQLESSDEGTISKCLKISVEEYSDGIERRIFHESE
jgi:hypothetical protein